MNKIILFLLSLTIFAHGQTYEYKFHANTNTKFFLDFDLSQINIYPSKNDSLKIFISLPDSNKYSKNFKPNTESRQDTIFFAFKYTKRLSKKIKQKKLSKIKIYIPVSNQLKLIAQNCFIFLQKHTGRLLLDIHNSKLTALELNFKLSKKPSFIRSSNSTIYIKQTNGLIADITNSHFKSVQAKSLRIKSKNSVFDIGTIHTLNLTSEKDSVFIDNVEKINAKSTSSFYKIKVNDIAEIENTNKKINLLAQTDFSNISITQDNGDLDFYLNNDASTKFEIFSFSGIVLLPKTTNANRYHKNNWSKFTGSINPNKTTYIHSNLNIKIYYGKLTIDFFNQ